MTYEQRDPDECRPLLSGGKLPLSAANTMNYLGSCLGESNWVANHYELVNILDPRCRFGWDEIFAPQTAVVYSDGSLSAEGAAGYGYAIHMDGLTVLSGNGRLGPAEVFDDEAKGTLEGLRAALNLPSPARIVACLDNLAVATCLRGMPADSSQREFLELQALAAEHGATEIRWIPGHTNIPGNEQADALAKAGTSPPDPVDALRKLAYLRKVARRRPKNGV
ncbi:endonuclease/exonuclease/phosphatase [Purpureocillium lavendulum]|uniref:Endonuclease/exonuclease/phosphatase n=1 Tax=Purpureocillium lavendulum TaxID=1247861 RepID=A0AB34FG31_9HYPO|nr:endonuclease/exonuclease/phosphatase [Purpureocillium lavendulum]